MADLASLDSEIAAVNKSLAAVNSRSFPYGTRRSIINAAKQKAREEHAALSKRLSDLLRQRVELLLLRTEVCK